MATNAELVTQLYIGYYDRAPDPEGLNYWIGRLEAGVSIEDVADSFATSPEALATYPYLAFPNLANASDLVEQVYLNVLGRVADPEGLAYYVGQLESGERSVGQIIAAIVDNAATNDGSPDQALLANKVEVALYWANEAANTAGFVYDGPAAASANSILTGVTADDATVDAAKIVVDDFFVGGPVGATFNLTPGVDLASPTFASNSGIPGDFRFTDKSETIESLPGTLGAGDVFIDNSTTDNDVLNASLNAASGAFTAQNIETINANFIGGGAGQLQLNNVTGTNVVNVSGSAAGQVSGINAQATSPVVKLNGYTNTATVTASTLAGTTAAGTAETLNVAVSGASFGSTPTTQSAIVLDAGVAGVLERLNLTSEGSAANTFSLGATGQVTGIGALHIDGTQDATIRVNSAFVTGITVDATENDGVTTLDIARTGVGAAVTNLTNVTGVDAFNFRSADNNALNVTNVESGASVQILSNFAGGTLSVRGAAARTDDVLDLTLDHATAETSVVVGPTTIANVETLNLSSNGNTAAATGAGNAFTTTGDYRTITVDGDTAVALQVTVNNPTAVATTTIDASGLTGTGGATITAIAGGANNRFDITGSDKGDVITGSANADVINGGAGNDIINLSAGLDTLTGGEGRDTFVASNAILTANVAGNNSTITDFTTGSGTARDAIQVAAADVGADGYYEGTAAGLTAATAYSVIVLTEAYANVAAAEAAIAAQSTSATAAVVVFLNEGTGFAQAFYDADIDNNDGLSDDAIFATFENITTLTGVAGFDAANFTIA